MKKYLSLILALCLPALLGGCGAVHAPHAGIPDAASRCGYRGNYL